jgi:hypothetical protein
LRWVPLILAIFAVAPDTSASGDRETQPGPALLRTLEDRGFAVDGSTRATLTGTYRWPGKDPVYVSSDAGLAVYLLLLRRAQDDLAFIADEALGREAVSWDEAVRRAAPGAEGRAARFVTAVLVNLTGAKATPPGEDIREAVETQVIRLLGNGELRGAVEFLGTPLDEAHLRALIRNATSPEQAHADAAVFWLSRVRITPAEERSRKALVDTLPTTLRDRILGLFRRAGVTRVRFPGEHGVFDVAAFGDQRFPPGTLPSHAEAVGLDLGARLGSRLARELIEKRPVAGLRDAGDATPEAGTIAADFDGLLRHTLGPADPKAPALFRSRAWEAQSLQSALAANALFLRGLGPVQDPTRVFGAESPPYFVHPDPAFWEGLSTLARKTAEMLTATGPGPGLPAKSRVQAALDRLGSCVREWVVLPQEDLDVLRRCRLGGWNFALIESVGKKEAPSLWKEEAPQDWKQLIQKWLKPGVRGPLAPRALEDLREWASRTSEDSPGARWAPSWTGPLGTVSLLERLAEVAGRASVVASMQLAGGEFKEHGSLAIDFGLLSECAEGFFGAEYPHAGCVVVLDDPPLRLVQGSTGLRDLWLLYPWKSEKVRARGVVFGYGEFVGVEWPSDARWRDLVVQGRIAPPPWAEEEERVGTGPPK